MPARYEPVPSPDESTIFPYHDLTPPTLQDVYRARHAVYAHLTPTPLTRSEWLSTELDADVYLKREDTHPTGAFKVRGGLNLVANLDPEFTDPGLIAASTGNHGQSIAYAGRAHDIPVVIGVPENANPGKIAMMERYGARVVQHGRDFDEAREWVETQATEEGYRYVHSANEPDLIAGVGTAGLEVLETLPDVDIVFCPVGGGSSASGYCLTVGALPDTQVIGVQSEAADAVHRAYTEGHLEPTDYMGTFAEGLATRVPFALTTGILRDHLDNLLLVPDDALRTNVRHLLEEDHILAEGAAVAGIAGMLAHPHDLAGKTIVTPISGRNIDIDRLRRLLT